MSRLELILRSKPVLVLGFLLFSTVALAQRKLITAQVRDFHSDEPVPFASVYFKGTTSGGLTDSAGDFSFSANGWPSDTVEITCVGYQPYRLYIDPKKDSLNLVISLERGTFSEGVIVKVKVNKGLLVWRKIVKNKPRNDRYRFNNFSYELYNKLEIDLKNLNFRGLARLKPLR
ncbi:MAG TPA: carboxypeptidase-like regulatory domain-containing protein, partial [Chitinophagaceae bacterium]